MLLYADEDFPLPVVRLLRGFGHDVLTAQEDGHTATPDPIVLARAVSLGRALMTHNRRDFERLHRQGILHCGILAVRRDGDSPALAIRLHAALAGLCPGPRCIRVKKPPAP